MSEFTINLPGNPANAYFRIFRHHLRALGLEPNAERPALLQLVDGADGTATLRLPNGVVFTADELTRRWSGGADVKRGYWEIWAHDPCTPLDGTPAWEMPHNTDAT